MLLADDSKVPANDAADAIRPTSNNNNNNNNDRAAAKSEYAILARLMKMVTTSHSSPLPSIYQERPLYDQLNPGYLFLLTISILTKVY